MEVAGALDPPPAQQPPASSVPDRPVSGTRPPQQKRASPRDLAATRFPVTPKGAVRDPRLRRSPPRPTPRDGERGAAAGTATGAGAGKSNLRLRLSPNALPKPLLPVTERKNQDEAAPKTGRPRRDTEPDKWDITPDGGSAGREGRHFAVANVGNNGRIYLRPTVRPAHQRYPQPHFVFPTTPPGTAGLDALATERDKTEQQPGHGQLHDGQWTPSQAPSTPTTAAPRRQCLPDSRPFARSGRRRAVSDSTIPDASVARESDPGGFKIVITHPGEEPRPRTLEDISPNAAPLIDVPIPSWKLGTPRFSMRGTPFICGSSCAPTDELRSSNASLLKRSWAAEMASRSAGSGLNRPGPGEEISHPPGLSQVDLPGPSTTLPPTPRPPPPHPPPPFRSTYMSTHLVIEPGMFDALTFKPACDDRGLVRYSYTSGAVTAATPPRLVAEITSPSFLDYELLSDFFLTFRAFLEPTHLLQMLVARLRWALGRDDEVGMVVRVRAFVATRHWILNYFMDDFVVDHPLRVLFCSLLNDFCDELSQDRREETKKVPIKILAELKKCWRRVCANYWDGPDFDPSLGPERPISPGGIAGHRDPTLDPTFWDHFDGPPQLDEILAQMRAQAYYDEPSIYAHVPEPGRIDSVFMGDRPATPEAQKSRPVEQLERRNPTSPTSITSLDVVSCSFPTKNLRFGQLGSNYLLATHPVDPNALCIYNNNNSNNNNNNDPIATTPRALTGKRVRPQHGTHKRNGSLTDSMRDHTSASNRGAVHDKNTEFLLMAFPYGAGSLVRGNMFPPGQAFVEILPPSAAGGPSRQATVFPPHHHDHHHHPMESRGEKEPASAMSGQGMRKLLGSVRRALSTRAQGVSPLPAQANFFNISPIGPRGATTNRLPGTAIVPQARPNQGGGVRPPIRIDILGAEIAEDFKAAIREEAAATEKPPENAPGHPAARMGSTLALPPQDSELRRSVSDAAITTGSKSIVIVDDTLQPEYPTPTMMMSGALVGVNPSSVEAFAEKFLPRGADPTPPTTPPGLSMGTPRRSSYILGGQQQVIRPSLSADPLPRLIPDLETLERTRASGDIMTARRPSADSVRPPAGFRQQLRKRPPPSIVRGHRRQSSSRSYRSDRPSLGRGRFASFATSGISPRRTVCSFDASTHSEEGSVVDDMSDVAATPQPPRVLRRRPGGDLRAANNAGDLDHHGSAAVRKSRSVGSLTACSNSVHISSYIRSPTGNSSGHVDVVNCDYSQDRADPFSLGIMAAAEQEPPKRNLSLLSTHSSKPVLRPSFEAEAQRLAQIPDDMDDDGGVESALLKLEGRYERRPSWFSSLEPSTVLAKEDDEAGSRWDSSSSSSSSSATRREKGERRQRKHTGDEDMAQQLRSLMADGTDLRHMTSFLQESPIEHEQTTANDEHNNPLAEPSPGPSMSAASFSGGSYSSTPLFERELTDDGRSRRDTRAWTNQSALQQDADEDLSEQHVPDSQHPPSYEFVRKTESMERIPPGETMPAGASRQGAEPFSSQPSFLDDESDKDSDLSSEMSVELVDGPGDDEQPGSRPARSNTVGISRLSPHPLGDSPPPAEEEEETQHRRQHADGHPPSPPPMAFEQVLPIMSPQSSSHVPEVHEHQIWGGKALPPTPDTTPTMHYGQSPESGQDQDPTRPTTEETQLRMNNAPPKAEMAPKLSVHLPFILAFDSDVLAQQFTLIEKDALNEIDWKDLIDMRWKDAANIDARSWVDFLRTTDARGVEVVIARFNIMVKWAVSEIVLTQDAGERARCLVKFIHIAAHCRRYRNFATMSQIAIALSSSEVARLAKTWAMVPARDLAMLRELETLVSPTRNFYNLRAEMEAGGVDVGCIPFVGIYTHDLLFNAQRPSEIAGSPTTVPLVNFERCRIAAAVVKTLLRLLEASALYDFQPIEGVTERCLWMGALRDDEIRRHSEALE